MIQGPAGPKCGSGSGARGCSGPPLRIAAQGTRGRAEGRGAGRGQRAARRGALATAGHLTTLYFTLVPFGIAVSSTSRQRMLQATRRTEMDYDTKNSRQSGLRPRCASARKSVDAAGQPHASHASAGDGAGRGSTRRPGGRPRNRREKGLPVARPTSCRKNLRIRSISNRLHRLQTHNSAGSTDG